MRFPLDDNPIQGPDVPLATTSDVNQLVRELLRYRSNRVSVVDGSIGPAGGSGSGGGIGGGNGSEIDTSLRLAMPTRHTGARERGSSSSGKDLMSEDASRRLIEAAKRGPARATSGAGAGDAHGSSGIEGTSPRMRSVLVVIMDRGGKEKERKAAYIKDKHLCEDKVGAFLQTTTGMVGDFRTRQSGTAFVDRVAQREDCDTVVLAGDLPILMLRELGSALLLGRGEAVAEALQRLWDGASNGTGALAATHKRTLRALIGELCVVSGAQAAAAAVAAAVAGGGGSGGGGGGNSVPLLSSNSGAASSGTPSAMLQSSVCVFLYSLCDDRFDMISFSPAHLGRAVSQVGI